jgi:hypothetical protein
MERGRSKRGGHEAENSLTPSASISVLDDVVLRVPGDLDRECCPLPASAHHTNGSRTKLDRPRSLVAAAELVSTDTLDRSLNCEGVPEVYRDIERKSRQFCAATRNCQRAGTSLSLAEVGRTLVERELVDSRWFIETRSVGGSVRM